MSGFLRDFRYAMRVLAKNPVFTTATVFTVGLGIGGACAMYSLVDAVALRPFLFRNADRIVTVAETLPKASAERMGVAAGNYRDWKSRSKRLRETAAYRRWNAKLGADENSPTVNAYQVTPGFFQLLGTAPLRGRLLSSRIDMNERNEIVISFGFWRDTLGGDPAKIGGTLSLNGAAYTVIGVMPKEFDFPLSAQMWAPLLFSATDEHDRTRHDLNVIAALGDGAFQFEADAELKNVAVRLAAEYPATNADRSASVLLLRDSVNAYAREFSMVLLAAAALLLMLACANAANMQLARTLRRQTEMAIRVAIGARRGRIFRQLAVEGLVLGFAASGRGNCDCIRRCARVEGRCACGSDAQRRGRASCGRKRQGPPRCSRSRVGSNPPFDAARDTPGFDGRQSYGSPETRGAHTRCIATKLATFRSGDRRGRARDGAADGR